jgi:phage N-6-adenine-methyltransferase
MSTAVAKRKTGQLNLYDPAKGLQSIAVAEAGEKHFRRAKDASKLFKAIETKIKAQADYVVWRDGVVVPSQKRGIGRGVDKRVSALKSALPDADPGDVVAHRWRKRFCDKSDGLTVIDTTKIASAIEDAEHRCQRICEQEKMGTVRGTEGTGEFERYTPAEYIEAARLVLGKIDLDPATSEIAQRTVRADTFFTEKTNGLEREWHGRVFLNPPYHRELAPKFIDKLVEEVAAKRTSAAIMLTNNCTDTEWFVTALDACVSVCFTSGRIKFTQPNGTEVLPTQGQAFFYFGDDVKRFEDVFCRVGSCLRPSRRFEKES